MPEAPRNIEVELKAPNPYIQLKVTRNIAEELMSKLDHSDSVSSYEPSKTSIGKENSSHKLNYQQLLDNRFNKKAKTAVGERFRDRVRRLMQEYETQKIVFETKLQTLVENVQARLRLEGDSDHGMLE